MGLDMYALSRSNDSQEDIEIAYWRKHNRLHGYMQNLWVSRGNTDVFNCQDLELTKEDIDDLELAIKNKELPETVGFFFGNDSYEDDYYYKIDLKFIEDAREALTEGNKVIYNCWW